MKYHLILGSSDTFGMAWIQNIVDCANMGAVVKEGTIPKTNFPHRLEMVLETEVPPTPTSTMRVFELESTKEVFANLTETQPVGGFSMDTEDDDVDKSLNNGVPYTKEQLEGMDWETEFKTVVNSAGITGRSRDKMTKEYLAKFA